MGQGRQDTALALTCIFPAIATFFVGLRTYSRYLGRNFDWDDTLMLVSWFLMFGQTVTIYRYIQLSHTGFHASEVHLTLSETLTAFKWNYAVQLFYHPLMGFIRASIIMFLFRLQDKRRTIQVMLHGVFWINVGYLISTFITNIFSCSPVSYVYNKPIMDHVVDGKKVMGGTCINSLRFILSSCALSIFMDLIIIPIPTAMVWNLHMRRKTKIAVVLIMSMGWVATAVSVVRFIVYYYRWQPGHDKTYDIGLIVSIIEPSTAVIAACAPALKRLFRHWAPRWFSDSEGPTYYGRSRSFHGRPSFAKPRTLSNKDPEGGERAWTKAPSLDEQSYGMHDIEEDTESMERINVRQPERTKSRDARTSTSYTESDAGSKMY